MMTTSTTSVLQAAAYSIQFLDHVSVQCTDLPARNIHRYISGNMIALHCIKSRNHLITFNYVL